MFRRLALLLVPVVVMAAACSNGSTASTASTSTTSTTIRTGPPSIRVLGDGVASSAVAALSTALGATDAVDRSVAGSSAVSWLNLDDPAAPDEGANHDVLEATLADAPSFVLVSLGAGRPGAPVDPLLRQRVMAVVFDLLAHTVDTKVIVVGSGAAAGSPGAMVDGEQAAAVEAVADAGASWAARVAFAPSPADVVPTLERRDWP